MTLREALERDLARRISDRLRLWTRDSIQLYQIADLDFALAMSEIALALTVELLMLTRSLGIRPETLTEIFKEAAKVVNRLEAQKGPNQ